MDRIEVRGQKDLEIQDSQSIGKPRTARSSRSEVVSLFSGCGGMDLGFKGGFDFLEQRYSKLPFEITWANELNSAACRTYRRNIGAHVREGDIWTMLDSLPVKADVVIGGFPCQDISVNGKGAGVAGKRSGLYRAMVEVVKQLRPKVFVAENVKGLLMKHQSAALHAVITDFRALGYNVTYNLYHAADYGVPQTRERVFIVGTLPTVKNFVHPSPILKRNNYITAREALDDLVNLDEDEAINHTWNKGTGG